MELIEIGRVGRAHGLKGEIKVHVEDHFEEDLLNASVVLIGQPSIPYFLSGARGGGALLLKFEDLDSREQVTLLSNQPIFLKAEDVSDPEPPADDNPFSKLVGYVIQAEGYASLGPIREIVDLPEHYLASIEHEGKEFFIPLHEDLIVAEYVDAKVLEMSLPEGLLSQ
ncbi:16S rRNA processing protein RimM [Lewinellaceae bacterium SD302]|nr:16S rRNA processing protein RimM [Lewinellaceae bacterium SD302]